MEMKIGPSTLELVEGDITRQDTEAVVNAANKYLRPGGGVDGAIHRAGGPAIEAACRGLGGCPTGEARITTGGNLKARYVIHTVGPVYKDGRHQEPDVRRLVAGYVAGTVPDYQMSAWLMAVVLRGLDHAETVWLSDAMARSGRTVDLSGIRGTKVDKHSTGGVGDKTSLVLAPLAAAAGVAVPMISGRGLGHTGGTLDKLESIPGMRTDLEPARFEHQVAELGACFGSQTADIVPADRRLYALRDATATVESVPLIVSSILSKKFAEGIHGVVIDVKCGSGAFMRTYREARELASALEATGAERLQNAFLLDGGGGAFTLFLAPYDLKPAKVPPVPAKSQ
jgi:hypothetical protein